MPLSEISYFADVYKNYYFPKIKMELISSGDYMCMMTLCYYIMCMITSDPSVENMTESQTLNISSHSGGKMKAGHTVASIGENSENSDWDSWDDEEDEVRSMTSSSSETYLLKLMVTSSNRL